MHSIYLSHLAWKPSKKRFGKHWQTAFPQQPIHLTYVLHHFCNVGVRFKSTHYSWLFCSIENNAFCQKEHQVQQTQLSQTRKGPGPQSTLSKMAFYVCMILQAYMISYTVRTFIFYTVPFFYSIWHTFRVSSRCIRGDHRTLFKQKPCALFCANTWQAPPSRPALWWLGQARHSR